MTDPSTARPTARRIRMGFLRVGLWASAAAFVLIEGYALLDQWLIGHASALFMFGTALLSAGVCIGLFALINAIGFAVSLFFGESALNPTPEGSSGGGATNVWRPFGSLRGGGRRLEPERRPRGGR